MTINDKPLTAAEILALALNRQCANCRWGMAKEDRYDQVHCINEDSQEAFGDVEATFTCELFTPRRKTK